MSARHAWPVLVALVLPPAFRARFDFRSRPELKAHAVKAE